MCYERNRLDAKCCELDRIGTTCYELHRINTTGYELNRINTTCYQVPCRNIIGRERVEKSVQLDALWRQVAPPTFPETGYRRLGIDEWKSLCKLLPAGGKWQVAPTAFEDIGYWLLGIDEWKVGATCRPLAASCTSDIDR